MDTIMYNALVDAAYTTWDNNRGTTWINGVKVITPRNQVGLWAGHLLVDVLRIEDPLFAVGCEAVYVVKDCYNLPVLALMHEIGHCIDPTAVRPEGYVGNPHSGKGARYEKRADLYALRWAVTQDDPGELISTFADYLMDASAVDSDALWRSMLILRYVRRYYPQYWN